MSTSCCHSRAACHCEERAIRSRAHGRGICERRGNLICHSREGGNLYRYFYRFLIKTRNDKGFTLIELLIAVSAVSIILVSLAAAATRAIAVQTQARQEAQATKLAEEQIERIRAFRDRQGFDSVTCDADCYLPDIATIDSSQFVTGVFTIWITVSAPPAGTCPAGNKHIVSTAQWGAASNLHQSTVTTCLSDWK